MANWKYWFCASAAVALLTTSCLAQSFTFTLRQNGNLLGANYYVNESNRYASVSISPGNPFEPASAKGQDTYVITWSFTSFTVPPSPPDPPLGLVSINATAIVPVSKIKLSVAGVLSFDLDVSDPEVLGAGMLDCTSLPCTQSRPASFPLRGSFAWYTGTASSASRLSGSQDLRNVDPVCLSEQSFYGQRTSGSANFSGTIGSFTVVPPPVGSNGSMNLSKGTLRLSSVCTPPPM